MVETNQNDLGIGTLAGAGFGQDFVQFHVV